MHDNQPDPSPSILRLNAVDYWYWTRYYVDVFRECPFRCAYCHTGRRAPARGLRPVPGLPDRRITVGLGLFCDVYGPGAGGNQAVAGILRGLYRKGNAVTLQTKSDQVVRHLDLLRRFAEQDRARVTITLITTDPVLAADLEGASPPPRRRLQALRRLRDAGVPAGVAATPLVPLVNDNPGQLEELVAAAAEAGAGWLLFSGFDPVPRFFRDHRRQPTAALMQDPDRLQRHYRETAARMAVLAARAGLSLRIPRVHRGRLERNFACSAVSEHLFTISYYHELAGNTVEAVRYRRAAYRIDAMGEAHWYRKSGGTAPPEHTARSLRGCPSLKSIVFQKKLGYIRGVNPEIESVIEEFTETGSSRVLAQAQARIINE
ncbi:MAG: hypothetical protein ACOC8N_10190 [Spirochaetota bacterium]